MIKTLNILLIGVLITFLAPLQAAHIIGGDVTYTCTNSNPTAQFTDFNVVFTVYRDASGGGAAYDNPGVFGLFSSSDGMNWTFVDRFDEQILSIEEVDFSDPCVSFPPELAVEKGVYSFDVSLPWDNKIYKIAYQRCCRNSTINNIVDPASTGAVYSIDFFPEAIRNCNNSPVFNSFPPIIICLDQPIDYDSGATDVDGDVIQYELCTPFTAGGTDGATTPGSPTSCTGVVPAPEMCIPPFDQIDFLAPLYDTNNPLGANANVAIDPNTGFLTGTPDALGQYVVGICMNEYRNGVLMSRVRRDFQFNIAECIMPESSVDFDICLGDSVAVNGVFYDEAGEFEQSFLTNSGCDSTLNISIAYLSNDTTYQSVSICEGESVTFNNETYSQSGTYQQVQINEDGCDSVLIFDIEVLPSQFSSMDVEICEGSSIEINNEIYTESGIYEQLLVASNGCDSVLTIILSEFPLPETILNYSLCEVDEIQINNETYDTEGQFVQVLQDLNGCDSTLVINVTDCAGEITFDFELCNSFGVAEAMNYSEFVPSYNLDSLCGKIVASNVYRDNAPENKHSCTEGVNNSVTMCISALDSCDWDPNTDKAIVVELTMDEVTPGTILGLSQFSFYHKSPLQFDWIDGPEGLNNYPLKYNFRIFKDDNIVYEESALDTSNDWELKSINFNGNSMFLVEDSAIYRFEITPYCLVGNESEVAAWDVDDFKFSFSCFESESRVVAGRIENFDWINTPLQIEAINLEDQSIEMVTTDHQGFFHFDHLSTQYDYLIRVDYTQQVLDRISTKDLDLIKSHILGLQPFNSTHQYIAADANGDQRISMTDVNLFRRLLVGMDQELKWNEPWKFYIQGNEEVPKLPYWNGYNLILNKSGRHLNDLRIMPIKIGDVDKQE